MLQPFREEYLFLFKFAVNDGTDSRGQLELETGSSESSPPSQSESSVRHPPDSAASTTSEIFMSPDLGGQFLFSAAMVAKDARNVTYKERIKMTPYMRLYGKKDIAKFRAFGCSVYVYLNEERRGTWKGQAHSPSG